MIHYQYSRLLAHREVRLIDIQPLKEDDVGGEIYFSLVVYPINECPPYVALSYAWGDATDTRVCYCDEQEFAVSESLHGALAKLRNRDTPSPVWVDAISINQHDLDEKNRQVGMMREIYSRAIATIVWLGEMNDGDAVAIQLMHNLNSAYPHPRMIPHKGSVWVPGGTQEFNHLAPPEQLGLPPLTSPEWGKLVGFYRKPWFSRMWIVQELCVSSQCVMWCGGSSLQPFVVLNAAFKMASYYGLGQGRYKDNKVTELMNAGALGDLREHFQQHSFCNIIALLRLTQGFKATVPHDRIFALLGIADTGGLGDLTQFPIDYRQSIQDTQISFMRWALEDCKSIDGESSLALLSFACHPTTSPNLPSWVPAWDTHSHDFIFLFELSRRRIPRFGDPALRITDDKVRVASAFQSFCSKLNPEVLVVSGKLFDTVQEVVPIPQMPQDHLRRPEKSSIWANMRSFLSQARHLSINATFYSSPADRDEALRRTLCLDCGGNRASDQDMTESDLQLIDAFEKCVSVQANVQQWEYTPISRYIPWRTKRDSHYISGQINLAVLLLVILAMLLVRQYPRGWWQWLLFIGGLCLVDYLGQQFLRFVPGIGDVDKAREKLPELFRDAWPMYENYADFWVRRSLCLSEGGRLGLVSERVRPGDRLCVLDGCGLAFALRSVQETGRYELISDAHLQGCMQGQVHHDIASRSQEIAIA